MTLIPADQPSAIPVALAPIVEEKGSPAYRVRTDVPMQGWAVLHEDRLWLWLSGLRPLCGGTGDDPYAYEIWIAFPSGEPRSLGALAPSPAGTALALLPLAGLPQPAAVLVTAHSRLQARPLAVVASGRINGQCLEQMTAQPAAASIAPFAGADTASPEVVPTGATMPELAPVAGGSGATAAHPLNMAHLAPPAQALWPAAAPPTPLWPGSTMGGAPPYFPMPSSAPFAGPFGYPPAAYPPGAAPAGAPGIWPGAMPPTGPAMGGGEAAMGSATVDRTAPAASATGTMTETAPVVNPAAVSNLAPIVDATPGAGSAPAADTAPAAGAVLHSHPPLDGDVAPVSDAAHRPAETVAESASTEVRCPPGYVPVPRAEVALAPHGDEVPAAQATAVLDFDRGGALVTLRGLPGPGTLGTSTVTGREYNAFRVWVQSSATREILALGIASRVWTDTYRLQVHEGIPLRRFDSLLVSVEDRAGTGQPAGPIVMSGRYRWYEAPVQR